MGDNILEVYNNLSKKIEKNNLNINNAEEILSKTVEKLQNQCLKSDFGKAVNSALDIGIRAIFPDIVEDQLINLKNNIYNYGLKEGINQTIDETINLGKSVTGVITNNFESISDAQNAIAAGGTVDKISDLIDNSIESLKNSKTIKASTAKTLKTEKNKIVKNIEKNIENSFSNQIKSLNNLEKCISSWNQYFETKDYMGMEKEFNKMKKIMNSLLPMENTLVNYRTIENLQNLIKNKGKNFDLTSEELELTNKLIN